jgi:formylglycine-generating enzyme required for sulfatase activity
MARRLGSVAATVAALSLAAGLSATFAGEFAPSAAAAEPPQAGQSFRDCTDVCPEMVVVPAGRFTMGTRDVSEGPERFVTIAKPFAAGKFEVTFAEWEACVAGRGCTHNPDDGRWGRGNRPVIYVSWNDAKQYVAWLSRKTGKSYRLLTEAEWEYAARAGSTALYSWGDDAGRDNANCSGCGGEWNGKQSAPAGSFKANAFGLHDMHGNIWEMVEDCWHYGYVGAPVDGSARMTGCPDRDERVIRGGGLPQEPKDIRATVRNNRGRVERSSGVGFRVARTL